MVILSGVFLLVVILLGLMLGSANLGMEDLLRAIVDRSGTAGVILWRLRMPRVLGAILSGMALSASGVLLQSAADNDLCSPNVIGVNAGAGLGVMVVLCFFPSSRMTPFMAFLGGFGATMLVLMIAGTAPAHHRNTTMILGGVAVGALLNAVISFLSQKYTDVLPSYVFFTTGGFNGVYWKDLPIPALVILICLGLSIFLSPKLNILRLGDDLAKSLGIPVTFIRISSLILASCLCGASVSYAGLLGFVGLIVPHMARRLIGTDIRKLLPYSCILGASLVVLADLIGRWLFAPSEISAGVFLSLIGGPFFIVLLYRRRKT